MKPVLLLVDDNEEILDFMSDDLGENYAVITATNGHEALALLQDEPVQLIVSDIMMPQMDGFELCRFLGSIFQSACIAGRSNLTLQSKCLSRCRLLCLY